MQSRMEMERSRIRDTVGGKWCEGTVLQIQPPQVLLGHGQAIEEGTLDGERGSSIPTPKYLSLGFPPPSSIGSLQLVPKFTRSALKDLQRLAKRGKETKIEKGIHSELDQKEGHTDLPLSLHTSQSLFCS